MSEVAIYIDNKEYGEHRLKRKIERLEFRIKPLEELERKGLLTIYGAEDLGRFKEAKSIYEDMLDTWDEIKLNNEISKGDE